MFLTKCRTFLVQNLEHLFCHISNIYFGKIGTIFGQILMFLGKIRTLLGGKIRTVLCGNIRTFFVAHFEHFCGKVWTFWWQNWNNFWAKLECFLVKFEYYWVTKFELFGGKIRTFFVAQFEQFCGKIRAIFGKFRTFFAGYTGFEQFQFPSDLAFISWDDNEQVFCVYLSMYLHTLISPKILKGFFFCRNCLRF
jgi:hypothetical protein